MHKRTFSTTTPQTTFGTQPSMFGQANTSTPSFSFGGPQPGGTQSTPAFGTQASPFGQPVLTAAASQSSFSFGSTAPSSTPFGAQSATAAKPSFSFGSNTQTNATGFGAQTTPSTQAPSSLPFGAYTQTTVPAFGSQTSTNQPQSSFSFGSNLQNNTSQFGTQAAQSKPAFSFGSTTQNTTQNTLGQTAPAFSFGSGLPGSNTNLSFGSQSLANNQSNFGGNANTPNQKTELQIWQELALIKAKWDTKSPLCYFKHFFYNMVHPHEVHRYVKPAEIDPALWAEAMRNNPDPSCMVPALAVGFDDVRKRMESQYTQCALYKSRLEAMTAKLEQLQRKHTLETLTRLAEHKRRHVDLTRRTIQVRRMMSDMESMRTSSYLSIVVPPHTTQFMKNSQLLRSKGFPIQGDEEKLRIQLENLDNLLKQPSEFTDKLNPLWSQIQQIRDHQHHATKMPEKWALVSEKDVQAVSEVLSLQHDGLAHIIAICQKDVQDLNAMLQASSTTVS